MSTDQTATPSQYVPWKEVAAILGVSLSSFFYLVNTRQISEEPGRGPRHGRYSLADIHAVKERRAQGKFKGHKPYRKRLAPVFLDWLSPDDIPAILRLDKLVYDEMYLAEMERYQQWSTKNGQLAIAAFDARTNRQEMLAYVAALPLDEAVILSVLRGKRQEIDITPEEIQDYSRPGGYTLLANSAVAHPERPDLLVRVLMRMMAEWVDRYPQRYVTRIYAQAESERGDLLIQHYFMQPRYDLAPNAYMLELARPGASRIIRQFQQRLAAKAPLPPELRWPPLHEGG